jgi:hypothetical protein
MARAARWAQQHAGRWDWEQGKPARRDDGRARRSGGVGGSGVGQWAAGQQSPDQARGGGGGAHGGRQRLAGRCAGVG